jgi:hypothetical protein
LRLRHVQPDQPHCRTQELSCHTQRLQYSYA